MTRTQLARLIELAFDSTAMEDAFVEAIQDYIDYDEIARNLLDQHSDAIDEIVEELAEEAI
ncbi:MAG: hypothetical protein E7451_05495 [Ruminococcaceae bacterium]|nr:hypothetical protein [Oscillospiraceae bacterium]